MCGLLCPKNNRQRRAWSSVRNLKGPSIGVSRGVREVLLAPLVRVRSDAVSQV